MAQEFTIKSEDIESKINQLLPSQGGFGAGVDFSASTMVVPIVDLTETAEGSGLRQDLQSSFSHDNITSFQVENTTTTIINTTGFFRLIGSMSIFTLGAVQDNKIILSDGATDKVVYAAKPLAFGAGDLLVNPNFDFIVLLKAGDSCKITASAGSSINGSSRQIADLSGNLNSPI